MSFNRPDLDTLMARVLADLQTRLPGVDVSQKGSVLAALGKTHAGAVHGVYGFLDALWPNLFVQSSGADFLVRQAGVWGIARVPAVSAAGAVAIAGSDGATLPAGSTFQRTDETQYTTQADGVIAGGVANVAILAVLAGAAGNLAADSTLSLVETVAGINGTATVGVDGITGGADAESDDSLRLRLLARIQAPPHGGARHDYVAWAKEAGATRAWALPDWLGIGTVGVTFVIDGRDDILPTVEEVATVQTHIDTVRPVTAAVTVFAPTPLVTNYQIRIDPNSVAVQTEVAAELADLYAREAELGARLYLSHIRTAVGRSAGLNDYTLIAPSADLVPLAHEIPVIGTITWSGP